MKNQLLLLICFIILSRPAFTQPDKQWVIWDGFGKEGMYDAISNKFVNNLRDEFVLWNVSHADYSEERPARLDLFMIYEDGAHYNSRYIANPGFFVPTATSASENINHNFKTGYGGGKIINGYLSRSYEEDDPPGSVKVNSSSGGQNSMPFLFNETIYTPTTDYPNDTLRANHNVVSGRDITIIIDQYLLDQIPDSNNKKSEYYLVYDQLEPLRDGLSMVTGGTYFQPEPVFKKAHHGNQPGFPFDSYSDGNPQKIQLIYQPGKRYTYINLRPTNTIKSYGPDATGERYAAVFRVVDGSNNTISRMSEPILSSYDPNLIRVDSIVCDGNDQVVFYHLQFQNTSKTTAASDVSASVTFPTYFDRSSFKVLEYSMKGRDPFGRYVVDGEEYTFIFDSIKSLDVCKSEFDITDCTGYVKFKINVPGSTNLMNVSNSLQLINPHTNFDGTDYPIDFFEDWVVRDEKKNNTWIRPVDCGGDIPPKGNCCWLYVVLGLSLCLNLWLLFRKKK